MLEDDLKRAVSLCPELIEDGLVIEFEEYPILADGRTFRCDLKGKDRNGRTTYIELKLVATDRVDYQIMKYRTYAKEPDARFLVAALEFRSDVPPVLADHGYEWSLVDCSKVQTILDDHKDNPLLYHRRTGFVKRQSGSRRAAQDAATELYSQEERQIVMNLFEELADLVQHNLDKSLGLTLVTPQPHVEGREQKIRLLFTCRTDPADRFAVYARSRIRDGLEFHYVPNFSLHTGSHPRKDAFFGYIKSRTDEIENLFDHELLIRQTDRHGDHLGITKQAWKGFSYRITRPLEEWVRPDFVELCAQKFISFVEKSMPIIEEFQSQGVAPAGSTVP